MSKKRMIPIGVDSGSRIYTGAAQDHDRWLSREVTDQMSLDLLRPYESDGIRDRANETAPRKKGMVLTRNLKNCFGMAIYALHRHPEMTRKPSTRRRRSIDLFPVEGSVCLNLFGTVRV